MIPAVKLVESDVDRQENDFLSSYQATVRQWIDGALSDQEIVSSTAFGNVSNSVASDGPTFRAKPETKHVPD